MFMGSEWRSQETWLVSDDGLWDIGVGLSLLGFGLTMSLGHAIRFIGFVMLAYFLVVMAGKEVITSPRMTNFEIRDVQVLNLAKVIRIGLVVIILCIGTGALMFMVFDIGATFSWLSDYGPIILGGILSIIYILFGYLTAGVT